MVNEKTESTTSTGREASEHERIVMRDGYLPDFEGNPVLASCDNCKWCMDQSDGPEYGPAWYACEHPKKSYMSNLKWFPFRTAQKCCSLNSAYMIDWDEAARRLGYYA